jgi:hypothetical protein
VNTNLESFNPNTSIYLSITLLYQEGWLQAGKGRFDRSCLKIIR